MTDPQQEPELIVASPPPKLPKLELEWQVTLGPQSYHLNGRGPTPEKAMEDLVTRAEKQFDTAMDEAQRWGQKVFSLETWLDEREQALRSLTAMETQPPDTDEAALIEEVAEKS